MTRSPRLNVGLDCRHESPNQLERLVNLVDAGRNLAVFASVIVLLPVDHIIGLYGMLRAWWIPYLLVKDPVRAARYQARFDHTLAFLPERNGIRPDTLHVTFHVVVLAAVVLLARLTL